MGNQSDKSKFNWSQRLGFDPDERTAEIQDMASRHAYIALVAQMVLLGGYLFLARRQTNAIYGLVAVVFSILYLLWQRYRLSNGGPLDERAQLTFNYQFRYMNVFLYLVCLLYPAFGGSILWIMLFFLPALAMIGTLLYHGVYAGRVWLLWLVISLVLGGMVGYYVVIEAISPVFAALIVILIAMIGAWIGVKSYRRPRSM